MAYNGSPNLQSSTVTYSPSLQASDGSNLPLNAATGQPTDNTQYIVNDPNSQVAYAVGPDGNPDLNNPIYVADNSTPVMMNNPPVTVIQSPQPPQSFWTKEVFIAIFGIIVVIIGAILLGVANSTYSSCYQTCTDNAFSSISYDYYGDYNYTDPLPCYKKCRDSYNAMKGSGIGLLIIGAIVLLGDGAFKYISVQQMQQQMQQPQMQQMQT